ncbi:CREB homolog crh-2 [Caenorhabditis elegans]|uniref:Isoform b of CREB homolog crh-2 n=1 Tax=Caenorhabditis elegans TaxID=6239 RepID=Q4JFH9-3|nr:CREB homolog crh-2 [Caenorhabditis elegans]CCD65812.1 CREB homolog crh-2 [Caenorhabditis elegans]|eukprot:NP_740986.2 CREB Homolog [Caenorhabditis elegans]
MDDDWATSGVLEKDVFISSVHDEKDTLDILKLFDNDIDGFSDDNFRIKMEPNDETSDYHGSSSGSPSSSLSSPNEFKDEPLGLDVHFGNSLFNAPFSPSATSSHSPSSYGMMHGSHSMASHQLHQQQLSPLPSVAHFSHSHHLQHHVVQHPSQASLQMNMNQIFSGPSHQYASSSVPHTFLFKDSTIYEGMGGMGLAAAQQQLKARNKMHEMAIRQHLITDQNITANGDLVLSAEERRTLVQEGYSIPQKYPLTKSEEESLKIVRRKIKNKLSAQESRRKRKEYIDALEGRLHCFSEENKSLKKQVHQLEASNRDLQQKLHQYESKEKM